MTQHGAAEPLPATPSRQGLSMGFLWFVKWFGALVLLMVLVPLPLIVVGATPDAWFMLTAFLLFGASLIVARAGGVKFW